MEEVRVKRETTILNVILDYEQIKFTCDEELYKLLTKRIKFYPGIRIEREAMTDNYTINCAQFVLYRVLYEWSVQPYLEIHLI